MPARPTTLRHDCVTFDDGEGHNWHVPFGDIVSIPRVGEEVVLPYPAGLMQRYSVVSIEYHYAQQDVPEGATGVSVLGNDEWMYARVVDIVVSVTRPEG